APRPRKHPHRPLTPATPASSGHGVAGFGHGVAGFGHGVAGFGHGVAGFGHGVAGTGRLPPVGGHAMSTTTGWALPHPRRKPRTDPADPGGPGNTLAAQAHRTPPHHPHTFTRKRTKARRLFQLPATFNL